MVLLPQPISKTMVDAAGSTGGNALGLVSHPQMCEYFPLSSPTVTAHRAAERIYWAGRYGGERVGGS